MKTVFNNRMVAHVWAQQNQSEGRSHNGNFSFHDSTIYSYRTPVARFVKDVNGNSVVLVTNKTHSMTTSGKHLPAIWRAISGHGFTTFRVPNIDYLGHKANLADLIANGRNGLKKAKTLRFDSYYAQNVSSVNRTYESHTTPADCDYDSGIVPRFLDYAESTLRTAESYAEHFGLDFPREELEQESRAALALWRSRYAKWNTPQAARKREQAKAARERAIERKEAAERERQAAWRAQQFTDWKAGNARRPVAYWYEDGTPERAELDAMEQAEQEQALRDAAEAFALWEAGNAPRPSPYRYQAGSPERAAIEQAEREELEREQAAIREQWLAGFPVRFHGTRADGTAYVRAMGDTLETSLGASVPLSHAIKAFRFIKAVRAKGETWTRNGHSIRVGHFQIDSINPDGSFKAGCHRFAFDEIERLATKLGVADMTPSDEIVESAH